MGDAFVPTFEGWMDEVFNCGVVFIFHSYCSDFRYESNGIFVLGVGFFSSDKFRLFN